VHHGSPFKLEYLSNLVKYLGQYPIGQEARLISKYNQSVMLFISKALLVITGVQPAKIP